jgi:hypothetical protein
MLQPMQLWASAFLILLLLLQCMLSRSSVSARVQTQYCTIGADVCNQLLLLQLLQSAEPAYTHFSIINKRSCACSALICNRVHAMTHTHARPAQVQA